MFGFVLAAPESVSAEVLDEAAIVARIEAIDPGIAGARAAVSAARARARATALPPTGTVAWDSEQFVGNGAEGEQSLAVNVPLDLGGRRRALRALAERRASRADATRAGVRSRAVVRGLRSFLTSLALRDRCRIVAEQLQTLIEADRIIQRRYAEGTVSGYESDRIGLANELLRSESTTCEAELETELRGLAILLSLPRAQIQLPEQWPHTGAVDDLEGSRPGVTRALDHALQWSTTAKERSRFAWLPAFGITAGARFGTFRDRRYGYVVGLSIDIPMVAQRRLALDRSQANAQLDRADLERVARDRELAHERARVELRAVRTELQRFELATGERARRIERTAASAYQLGEIDLLEWIDATRARAQVERRRLELRRRAAFAWLAVREARGDFE